MILAADCLHAMNPRVAAALDQLDPEPLRELARRAERAGAQMLDLNPGYLSRRREDRMAFMVEAAQEAASLPLILDSPSAGVLARGLSVCERPVILNAVSLEERKLEDILPLAVEHGADLVALLMDEKSFPPPRLEEKLGLALELRAKVLAAGLPAEKLIFDPVLPTLSWPEAMFQAGECVRTVRLLASGAFFQEPARTMAGLSNLRSTQRSRIPVGVELAVLGQLAGAGLEIALADVLQDELAAGAGLLKQMD